MVRSGHSKQPRVFRVACQDCAPGPGVEAESMTQKELAVAEAFIKALAGSNQEVFAINIELA